MIVWGKLAYEASVVGVSCLCGLCYAKNFCQASIKALLIDLHCRRSSLRIQATMNNDPLIAIEILQILVRLYIITSFATS